MLVCTRRVVESDDASLCYAEDIAGGQNSRSVCGYSCIESGSPVQWMVITCWFDPETVLQ